MKRGDIILVIWERRKGSKNLGAMAGLGLCERTAKLVVIVIRRRNKDTITYGSLIESTSSI